MKQSNIELVFVKLIISSSERKAAEDNMTEEQKKEYINKRLLDYMERMNMKLDEAIPIYKESYADFSKDDFIQYVITHTTNVEIILDEKIKLEKKIEMIAQRLDIIDRQIGSEEELSPFEMEIRKFQQREPEIDIKINQIKKKYELPVDTIIAKRGENISSERLQDFIDLIGEMINSSSSVEELYEMAKNQIGFFNGMGKAYEEELRKKAPELFEYIDTLIKNELTPVLEEKQKLQIERIDLKKLKEGLAERCRNYDKRLPEKYKGTAQERQERERREIEERRRIEEEERRIREEIRRRKEEREREEKRQREEMDDFFNRSYRCYDSGGCGSSGC